jgi:hypothetical protein
VVIAATTVMSVACTQAPSTTTLGRRHTPPATPDDPGGSDPFGGQADPEPGPDGPAVPRSPGTPRAPGAPKPVGPTTPGMVPGAPMAANPAPPMAPAMPGTPATPVTPTAPMTPPAPINPNALRYARDIQPLMEQFCTECHHPGKSLDLTRVPFRAGATPDLVDQVVARATMDMPPAPRDRMPADALDKIRQWKTDGMVP